MLRLPQNLTMTCSKCSTAAPATKANLLPTPVESTLHDDGNFHTIYWRLATEGLYATAILCLHPNHRRPHQEQAENLPAQYFPGVKSRERCQTVVGSQSPGNVTNGLHFDHPARRLKLRVAEAVLVCPGLLPKKRCDFCLSWRKFTRAKNKKERGMAETGATSDHSRRRTQPSQKHNVNFNNRRNQGNNKVARSGHNV